MSVDNIRNFISPSKTVINWARAQINTLVDATMPTPSGKIANDAEIYQDQDESLIFNWIHKAKKNQAIVKYVKSIYSRDGKARRILTFDVYAVYRYTTNRVTSQDEALDLLDAIIGVLDHEGDADYLCYVVADALVDFPNAGLTVCMATFEVEDY